MDMAAGTAAVRRQQVTTHSETLLVLIDECLGELGLSPGDLSGVICGAGPGSFTGLRIGAATAKGLCFALGIPLVMVSTLQTMAARSQGERTVLSCLYASRGQVYAQLFPRAGAGQLADGEPELLKEAVWEPGRLAPLLGELAGGDPLFLCGDGPQRYPELLVPGSALLDDDPWPRPLDLLALGSARLSRGESDPLRTAVPSYVCPAAAERNIDRGRGPGPGP